MESLEVILMLLGCVLASSILDQLLSRTSLPLVQIAMGAVVGCFVHSDPTAVFADPEFFLLIFIAPLLFDESRHADKSALWKNKVAIMSLAFGLVFITTLVVGFVLNWFVPSIPLAAAFALGAALGPTDAAAVAALGKDLSLTRKQKALLSGEALFNDASGVVAFEFAIAAVLTGSFSLMDASLTFCIELFGSIALGLALGGVTMFALGRIRALGLETATVFLLFEVCMPFVTYLAAEGAGLSGILAVVAAGLFMKFYPSKLTVESSKYAVASNNIWELLSFVLNGIVFVLLGMKLPQIISSMWVELGVFTFFLVFALIIVITIIVMGVRYVWLVVMEKLSAENRGKKHVLTREKLQSCAVTTLAGPKGAVTLSIVLSIPYLLNSGDAFPHRDLLIFMASGVIMLTLVLANYVVPLLAAEDEDDEEDREALKRSKVEVEILQNVIDELLANETPETSIPTQVAVKAYRDRINLVREREVSDETLRELRIEVMHDQLNFVREKIKNGEVNKNLGSRYADSIRRVISVQKVRQGEQPATPQEAIGAGASVIAGADLIPGAAVARPDLRKKEPITWILRFLVDKVRGTKLSDEKKLETVKLIVASEERALQYLNEHMDEYTLEQRHAAGLLRTDHTANLNAMRLRVARMEQQAVEEAREAAEEDEQLEDAPELAPEAKKVLATAKKRQAQLNEFITTPATVGGIDFDSSKPDEDADLSERVSSAANTMLDVASTASAALAGEDTHTGKQVRGTFLGRRRVTIKTRDIEAEALSMELDQIQAMREAGRLSNADARELREEVYLLQLGLEAR